MKAYYLITITFGEPELHGPYNTDGTRDAAARYMVSNGQVDPNEDEYVLGLDVDDGVPHIFSYGDGFLRG